MLCNLLEGFGKDNALVQQTTDINLDNLIRRCCKLIQSRPIYEDRHNNEEDEGLCGLLRMVCAIVKYNISFKESVDGRVSDGIPSFFFFCVLSMLSG